MGKQLKRQAAVEQQAGWNKWIAYWMEKDSDEQVDGRAQVPGGGGPGGLAGGGGPVGGGGPIGGGGPVVAVI